MIVIKRDGREVDFDYKKIENAVSSAVYSSNMTPDFNLPSKVSQYVIQQIKNCDKVTVEQIQDLVERALIHFDKPEIAKEYIIYRDIRSRQREASSDIVKTIKAITITDSKNMNLKRENANIDADTSMGTMLKYGSEVSKMFSSKYMLRPEVSRAHINGDIHVHDLDFYPLTETCCQIDIGKLLKNGFSTGHGTIREPSNINTAAQLACIAIQCNQNEMHGGQAIPAFDFGLAPYVAKSYIKNLCKILDIEGFDEKSKEWIRTEVSSIYDVEGTLFSEESQDRVLEALVTIGETKSGFTMDKAYEMTDKNTYQAMECVVHNMNTMHSRAGAQVPFSSLNYGTDVSEEGRMITKNLLLALEAGMGNGETPIFPVHIFKLKEGVSYNSEDPNYDLFKLACRVSAKRLFPNFSFLDSPFNLQYYKPNDPNTEVAYMGCTKGNETISISIEGKVYNNIPIEEAFSIIKSYKEEHI